MHPFPHVYRNRAAGGPDQAITVSGEGLPDLATAAPPEFDGPGDLWSPETMLNAAVANCFILTFRSLSKRKELDWQALDVAVEGQLDKTPEGLRFTAFRIAATLEAAGVEVGEAEALLHAAERHCLITASLSAEVSLEATVRA